MADDSLGAGRREFHINRAADDGVVAFSNSWLNSFAVLPANWLAALTSSMGAPVGGARKEADVFGDAAVLENIVLQHDRRMEPGKLIRAVAGRPGFWPSSETNAGGPWKHHEG